MRYEFIAAHCQQYPIFLLCRVMKVSRSGFYAYLARQRRPPDAGRIGLEQAVKSCFLEHRRRYGSRRVSAELKAQGLRVGRHRVRTVMRRLGLQAIQPKRFVPQTTNSQHQHRVSPNLLMNQETTPQQVVVGDITYLPLQQGGWCYLAIWQDSLTKQIIGWAVENSMTDELIIKALRKAAHKGHLQAGMIIHSDQGSQYASRAFRQLLEDYHLRQSMSRRANCYDNAQAESFFARFKTELLEGGSFANLEQARSETFSYIEGYYNCHRRHSALGYQTPLEFIYNLNHSTQERTTETLLSKKT